MIPVTIRHSIIATILCAKASVASGNELDRVICNHGRFLSCMGATVESCLEARQRSEMICDKRFPITKIPDDESRYAYAKEVGRCSVSEFSRLLKVSISKFGSCSVHLEPIFDNFMDRERERIEKRDRPE